jgi:hypothetical protein
MGQTLETTVHGAYKVSAYRLITRVEFGKPGGCDGNGHMLIHMACYPSRDDARPDPGHPGVSRAFNEGRIPIGPLPTALSPTTQLQPDGTELVVRFPPLPAYKDLVGAPISSWLELAEGETLAGLSLHDLVYRLGYLVAGRMPDAKDAERV